MLQSIFGNIDQKHWRDTLGIIQFSIKKCERNDLPRLMSILRPILRDILHKDDNLESDKIENVYRIYHVAFTRFEDERDPVFALEILEELSSILFRLSCFTGKSDLPWKCLSEECCLTLVQVIQKVMVAFTQATQTHSIYSPRNLPLLSHLCSTLLEMAEFATWRAVRKEALQSLKILFHPNCESDRCLTLTIRISIAHFLPGICQTFYRIVTGDVKIGSTVKETAFDAWTVYLLAVFGQSSDIPSRNFSTDVSATETTSGSVQSPTLFSSDWFMTTIQNLNALMEKTIDCLLHIQWESDVGDNDRVSIAFTRWLASILSDGLSTIDTNIALPLRDTIVGALVTLAAQSSSIDLPQSKHVVRSSCLARDALLRFVQNEDGHLATVSFPKVVGGSRLLRKITIDFVCSQVTMLTTQLPIVIDEAQIQKRLRSIYGCLTLMNSDSLSVLVSSRDLLHRLCTGLADFLVFNTNAVELFTTLPTVENNQSWPSMILESGGRVRFPNLFDKSFMLFRDPKTLLLIQALAAQLASQDNTMDLFFDTCRDVMLQSGGLHRNACLLLIASGLAGFLSNESTPWKRREMEGLRILNTYFETDLSFAMDELNACAPSRTTHQLNKEAPLLESIGTLTTDTARSVVNDVLGSNSASGTKDIKQNTITVCLLLELVCIVSELYVSQRHVSISSTESAVDAEDLLRLVLPHCFILASWSGIIGQTANRCLQQLAVNCANSGLGELITHHADYLISSITLELHRVVLLTSGVDTSSSLSTESLTSLQSACHAMNTLFEHARYEILPLLRPMVRQVLSCLDLTYEHHSALFLPALKRLVLTCRQWHAASQNLPIPEEIRITQLSVEDNKEFHLTAHEIDIFQTIASKTQKNLSRLIVDTRRLHQLPLPDSVRDAPDHPNQPETDSKRPSIEDEEEPSSRVYPDQLHIVEEVMLRCIHLLATTDPKLRMLSMEVLMEGCVTLANESELLLPLVHKIWSSLMARFRDRHAIVVEKAFQFLIILSNVAGDFLRVRASSDVVPALLTFLNRGVNVSANASESYRHLTCYRVQRDLLCRVGTFCSDLGLASDALRPVVRICVLYLAENQPLGLQQAARQSLKALWAVDPGLVWTVLLSRVPHGRLTDLFPVPRNSEQCFSRIQQNNHFEGEWDSGINPDVLKNVLSELTLVT